MLLLIGVNTALRAWNFNSVDQRSLQEAMQILFSYYVSTVMLLCVNLCSMLLLHSTTSLDVLLAEAFLPE